MKHVALAVLMSLAASFSFALSALDEAMMANALSDVVVAPVCKIGTGIVQPQTGRNDARDPLAPVSKSNKEMLSRLFEPQDLVRVPYEATSPEIVAKYAPGNLFESLRAPALKAVIALLNYARAEGIDLALHSGYRSYAAQCMVFNNKMKEEFLHTPALKPGDTHSERVAIIRVNRRSALPGQSEHQLGTAVDLVTNIPGLGYKLEEAMDRTPAFAWLSKNAYRFGFVLTYPKGPKIEGTAVVAATGYVYEPWHWRYIGISAATAFRACESMGLTSQDFLRALKENPSFKCTGTQN